MNSRLPSRSEAWARLRSADPPSWVLDHVACVERLAVAMAREARDNGHDLDMALVHAGAILHDLGRSITQDTTHAYRGAMMLEAEGVPDALVRIVARHTGAGLSAKDAAGFGLPAKSFVPETLEERIVAHADNLYSGGRRLSMDDVRAKYEAKGLVDAWHRIEALHATLTAALGRDPQDIAPAELPPA